MKLPKFNLTTFLIKTIRLLAPMTIAVLLIWMEPLLGALTQQRPGIIPVALLSVIAGLLIPQARRYLIATLCFGVSMLAFRDAFRSVPLPVALSHPIVEALYPWGWGLLSLLALLAGLGESLFDEPLWARRCYFSAASLYFIGHGVFSFSKLPNWKSVIMIVVGLVSAAGVFTANRLNTLESEEIQAEEDIQRIWDRDDGLPESVSAHEWVPVDDDADDIAAIRRRQRVRRKEWHETPPPWST